MTDLAIPRTSGPVWLWLAASFGIAWNIFGLIQLIDFAGQTQANLMMKGMTAAAAELYHDLPRWMSLAFALGSGGGLIGSVTLLIRRRVAEQVLLASLIGYVALASGDYAYGVFAVVPGQAAIIAFVVAVAAGLYALSVGARRRSLLR